MVLTGPIASAWPFVKCALACTPSKGCAFQLPQLGRERDDVRTSEISTSGVGLEESARQDLNGVSRVTLSLNLR